MMGCEAFQEQLSAWVDGELTPDEQIELSAHVGTCDVCSGALRAFKLTSLLVRSLEAPAAPSSVTDAAMRAVSAGARISTESVISRVCQILFEPLWPKLGWEGMGLAAAAVLVAIVYHGELVGGWDHPVAFNAGGAVAGADGTNEARAVVPAQSEAPRAGGGEAPGGAPPASAVPRTALATGEITSAREPALQAEFSPAQQPGSAGEGSTIELPPIIEFAATDEQLNVIRPTAVFVAPDKDAPQRYHVKAGTRVEVIAKSKDGTWGWVTTADGAPAYILMADLGRST